MSLAAVQPTLAEQPAGSDRNLGLNNMVAGAQRVAFRIDERQYALLLIIEHDDIPENRQRNERGEHRAGDVAHTDAGEKNHGRAGQRDKYGGTEVGLDDDQADGHQRDGERKKNHRERRRQRTLVQQPGQHQRQAEFHDFRRLEAQADVQPSLSAFANISRDED